MMKEFSQNYLNILTGELAGLNLTRILEPEEFYQKQILDSIAPYEQSEILRESLARTGLGVDIGFGGGFPLLPLARLNSEAKFVGLEARGKKATAVQLIASKLGLQNVHCHHQRLETVLFNCDATVTLKAVGQVREFLEMFHVEQGTVVDVFFYKGPQVFELENLDRDPPFGWREICRQQIIVPGVEGRILLGYSVQNVPRRTKKNKELVNLTSLI